MASEPEMIVGGENAMRALHPQQRLVADPIANRPAPLLAAPAIALPRLITLPLALLSAWVPAMLLLHAWRLRAGGGSAESLRPGPPRP